MANKKISELTENITPSLGDIFPIVSNGETKKQTLSGLKTLLSNVTQKITKISLTDLGLGSFGEVTEAVVANYISTNLTLEIAADEVHYIEVTELVVPEIVLTTLSISVNDKGTGDIKIVAHQVMGCNEVCQNFINNNTLYYSGFFGDVPKAGDIIYSDEAMTQVAESRVYRQDCATLEIGLSGVVISYPCVENPNGGGVLR